MCKFRNLLFLSQLQMSQLKYLIYNCIACKCKPMVANAKGSPSLNSRTFFQELQMQDSTHKLELTFVRWPSQMGSLQHQQWKFTKNQHETNLKLTWAPRDPIQKFKQVYKPYTNSLISSKHWNNMKNKEPTIKTQEFQCSEPKFSTFNNKRLNDLGSLGTLTKYTYKSKIIVQTNQNHQIIDLKSFTKNVDSGHLQQHQSSKIKFLTKTHLNFLEVKTKHAHKS